MRHSQQSREAAHRLEKIFSHLRIYREPLKFTKKSQTTWFKRAKDLKRHFSQESVWVASKLWKNCSSLLVRSNSQWNCTSNPVGWLFPKLTINNNNRGHVLARMWRIRIPVPHWWECKMVRMPWKNIVEVPQKMKNRIVRWSSHSTPGYILQRAWSSVSKRHVSSCVPRSIIHNS